MIVFLITLSPFAIKKFSTCRNQNGKIVLGLRRQIINSKKGRFCRRWLGMQMTNLYAARLRQLEKIIQKFPNISKGVLVEEVIEGSPAERAGILEGDVIVRCAGKDVGSFLEFCGRIWDKKKESVKLVVIRTTSDDPLKLKVKLDEASPDKFYRWPLPEECRVFVKRVRM